jgi:hypothetical protein
LKPSLFAVHAARDSPQGAAGATGKIEADARSEFPDFDNSDTLSLNIDLSQFLAIKLLTSQAKREN